MARSRRKSGPPPPAATLTKLIAGSVASQIPFEVPEAERDEWRKHLVSAEQKNQEDLDKALLSLSAGALGISFAFLKDIVGPGPVSAMGIVVSAWACWIISLTCVILSYYGSSFVLRREISIHDSGKPRDRGLELFRVITLGFNSLAGLLFVGGVVLMMAFVYVNFPQKGTSNVPSRSPPVSSASAASSPGSAKTGLRASSAAVSAAASAPAQP